MTHLPRRIAGVALMGIAVLLYDAASDSSLHRLVLPLVMASAAWLMVHNAAAVLLGTALLAAIHADPDASDWIVAQAYPLLAILSAAGLGFIVFERFKKRIESTRAARWQDRQARAAASADDSTNETD